MCDGILQNQLASIKCVLESQQCHAAGFSQCQSCIDLVLIKPNFIFWIKIFVAGIMYLIQLLQQRTPREWKAKSMAIAGWKNWAWLIQSMCALRDSCWQPVSATVKRKHFHCSFISEEERWEAKVLTVTWHFQIVSLALVSLGGFFVKMVLK